jgi:hypothetical protein
LVLTVNAAWSAPAGIVTVAGTEATAESEDKLTLSPPVGAGPVIVTVPVDDAGPTTVVGLRVNVAKVGGVIVRVCETVTDPTDPEITARV